VQSYFAHVGYRLLSNSRVWLVAIATLLLLESVSGIGSLVAVEHIVRFGFTKPGRLFSGLQLVTYVTWVGPSLPSLLVETNDGALSAIAFIDSRN